MGGWIPYLHSILCYDKGRWKAIASASSTTRKEPLFLAEHSSAIMFDTRNINNKKKECFAFRTIHYQNQWLQQHSLLMIEWSVAAHLKAVRYYVQTRTAFHRLNNIQNPDRCKMKSSLLFVEIENEVFSNDEVRKFVKKE